MTVWHAPYTLQPRQPLNARSGAQPRHGSLLKIRFATGMIGYADCLPWPEFGDAPLPAQLNSLRGSAPYPTPLATRCLALACEDALARAQGVDLLAGADKLNNHHLVTRPAEVDAGYAKELSSAGFASAKLKIGVNPDAESRAMQHLAEAGLKLRPDFNQAMPHDDLEHWCDKHSELLPHCEFLEDPLPLGPAWQQLHGRHAVPLALDRAPLSQFRPEASVRVLKPAWHSASGLHPTQKLVVTHAMDHPVGQAHAAACANKLQQPLGQRLLDCGLIAHKVYADNPALPDPMPSHGPRLRPPGDVGIGYTDYLDTQDWIAL